MATSTGFYVIVSGLGFLGRRAMERKLLAHGKQVRVMDIAASHHEAASRLVHPSYVEYLSCSLGNKPFKKHWRVQKLYIPWRRPMSYSRVPLLT
jgi:hypothetical protein